MENLIVRDETFILVTDDDPVSRKLVEKLLLMENFKVDTASSGEICLEIASKSRPDLILLDINMPNLDGIETCKMLKQENRTCQIPIIFVTASTEDQTLREAFEAGATDYVRKPVRKIELVTRIEAALSHEMLVKKMMEEEKLKAVLETAGAVCHEMNQPLQFLEWSSDSLMAEVSLDSSIFDEVKKINENVKRLGEITRKLMGITKYETRDYVRGEKIIDLDKASIR